jgi:hypothetical protein
VRAVALDGKQAAALGVNAVVDRFAQLGPTVLARVHGERFAGGLQPIRHRRTAAAPTRRSSPQQTREHHSPRHVPDETVRAPAAPRTPPGKKLELPIKRVTQGTPLTEVAAAEATDQPEALRWLGRGRPPPTLRRSFRSTARSRSSERRCTAGSEASRRPRGRAGAVLAACTRRPRSGWRGRDAVRRHLGPVPRRGASR